LMAMVWLVWQGLWLRFARRAEVFAGFATFGHAHIRGLSQDLCSSHVRCLKSSPSTRGWVLRRRIAELCARAGIPRTASPTATGCQCVSVSRELVSS
jgi:hypothetical protein